MVSCRGVNVDRIAICKVGEHVNNMGLSAYAAVIGTPHFLRRERVDMGLGWSGDVVGIVAR